MQRFLAPAVSSLRQAVLSHVRVNAAQQQVTGTFLRGFAAGTYLEKGDVTERVLEVVKKFEKVDPAKVSPTASFSGDLGLDSLDEVEVVMAFEEEFVIEIPDAEADKITSCADAIDYIVSHPMAK
ncbi:Acyl carrier protein 2, mitochondrial [Cymbomonas tetramitiformis]|uniref:Acyl carrier protein n=1 Tax=Cymbomonas tetramitiformis TaxID=36881 RepID=A0AAE0KST2_9CHLO|nr:Acyl carrier protein 2, mitochondrial [Cymbomonas tetramitiformis]|eukprot:gene17522-20864_t